MTSNRPGLKTRLDTFQRNHSVAGFPLAVIRKYGDDEGGRHASLMTYYGFLALFPILLLVAEVISRAFSGNPQLRAEFIDAVVPEQFQATVDSALQSLPTNGLAYWVGLIGLVATSLGVVRTAHDTINHVAGIPFRLRLNFVRKFIRIVMVMIVMLFAIAMIGGLNIVLSKINEPTGLEVMLQLVGTVAILFLLTWLAVSLLLPTAPKWNSIWPMALLGAVVIAAFLGIAALLLPRLITNYGAVYGSFATIVGLLAFIALISQALVFSAEAAVVRKLKLWPRAIDTDNPTPADAVALGLLAREQERVPIQRVTSRLE